MNHENPLTCGTHDDDTGGGTCNGEPASGGTPGKHGGGTNICCSQGNRD